MTRDRPNSRFHGCDISVKLAFFCEKCLFPWNPWFFVNFNAFTFIYEGFRVLSAAFVQILLFAMCQTWALNSWHVFIMLLTYIPPHQISPLASLSLFPRDSCASFVTSRRHVLLILNKYYLLFIYLTPSVNFLWNWAYFQKHPVKITHFSMWIGLVPTNDQLIL